MAKPRFHVSMIVDAAALYEVTTAAAKRAYNVQITPVIDDEATPPERKANGADPDAARTPARIVLYPWWLKHKTFNIADAMAYAKEHDCSKGAVYTATAEAIKHGLLERTSSGVYKTIPAALKAAVKSATKPAVIVRKTDSDRQHGHGDFIIGVLKNGPLLRNAINAEFVSSARSVRSSDGAMHRLRQKKLIKQNADKTWELTAKGIEQGAE